jgi:prepilin-type N-terminal cleavage/methylation domain-containing protein
MTGLRSLRPRVSSGSRLKSLGFTLTELAVVMTIVALLIGGLSLTLSAQYEARQFAETQAKLELARDALVGFAIRNRRLPCPASTAGSGEEVVGSPTIGDCPNFHGILPARTLGIASTDGQGYLLDAWGTPIRYSVTSWGSTSPAVLRVFTRSGGMATVGVSELRPNFEICSKPTCSGSDKLTSDETVPAVIFSVGKNRRVTGFGTDHEGENFGGIATRFVSHEPRPAGADGGEFDDILIWLSVNVLVNRMVAAGSL